MNALKNLLAQLKANVPTPGSGAGSGLVKVILGIGALGGLGYAGVNSMVTVQPGHLGVTYSRLTGLNEFSTLKEGLNFVVPWLQRAVVFDIRTRPQLIQSQSGSKDLQIVQISLRVLFRPDPEALPFIYRLLGKDFDERVLPSIVNEVTKAVVAQYNAAELLTKREVVSNQIRSMLLKRATDFKIVLDDVSITHLAFSKEYTAAVEAKQVAQQDAERSKYIVEKAIQEKRSIVIRAEGEAKSAELIGHAIRDNPSFIQLRRIEAAKEVAATISNSANLVYLDSSTLLLNHLGNVSEDKDAFSQSTAREKADTDAAEVKAAKSSSGWGF